jgi:hypothetical protein
MGRRKIEIQPITARISPAIPPHFCSLFPQHERNRSVTFLKARPSNLFAIFAHSIFILGPPSSSARMAFSKKPMNSVFSVL